MILEIEDWCLGYSQILQSCRNRSHGDEEGSVHIYCNADADGLAAARIFTLMLRNDGISYQLVPCRSYSQLEQNVQSLSSTAVRAVVLLNLGATRNLTRLFTYTKIGEQPLAIDNTDEEQHEAQKIFKLDPSKTKIYVFDCRRPVHLANVHALSNIVIFWDVQNADEVPSDGENLSGKDSSDESSSDGSSSDESSSGSLEDSDNEVENEFNDDDDDFDDFDNLSKHRDTAKSSKNKYNKETDDDADADGNNQRNTVNHPNPASDDEENDDADDYEKKNKRRRQTMETEANTTMSQSSSVVDNNDSDIHDYDDNNHLNIVHHEDTNDMDDNEDRSTAVNEETTALQNGVTMTQKDLYEDRKNRIRAYYNEGKFYGSPASYVAYKIASELRFGDTSTSSSSSTDILWLACIGITDAYLHARLDVSGYSTLALQLRTHIHKIFPNDDFDRITNSVYAESLLWNAPNNNNPNQTFTRISFSDNGKLLSESDFRFFLLRHSSLYDAMVYSDFVSSKFQLSTARGLHRLHEMFAKMGFPLAECQQPFAYMKPKLKRQLHTKLMQNAEFYNLGDNFEYTSFFRITGYSSLLSASDVSYAITALLEFDPTSSAISGDKDYDDVYDEDEKIMKSFNVAFDALNVNAHNTLGGNDATNVHNNSMGDLVTGGVLTGSSGLGAGIRLAMSQQKMIMSTAFSLINRSAITRLNHFRYAYITCTSQAGTDSFNNSHQRRSSGIDDLEASSREERVIDHIFAKPLTLTRLAHYLMDVHRENGKWVGVKSRPLILLAEKPITQTYVVVGYEYPENSGDILRNAFGKHFELAAQSMNGKFLFDSFDSNVVEVAQYDVQRFIEQLHYLLETLSKSSD